MNIYNFKKNFSEQILKNWINLKKDKFLKKIFKKILKNFKKLKKIKKDKK